MELDVPLSTPGAPPVGDLLYRPAAHSQLNLMDVHSSLYGWVSSGTGGDTGGPQDSYVVGTSC